MLKIVYLENTNDNHNKFYRMTENSKTGSTSSFTADWGKIGTSGQSKLYPMADWHKIYNNKINKGYVETKSETKEEKANNWIVIKFMKLYDLIDEDALANVDEKKWVWDKMSDYDTGIVPEKEELTRANMLWKKYQ